jgi:hypothetical protein
MLLLLFSLSACLPVQDPVEYSIEFLCAEEPSSSPVFGIVRAESFAGGLRLFLDTNQPAAVADLLAAGALEAQLSDHEAETEATVALSLGKAVWCTQDGAPLHLGFADPLPACDGQPPARIEYYLEVPVSLGPNRDLAIGQDPDFLWLIEER